MDCSGGMRFERPARNVSVAKLLYGAGRGYDVIIDIFKMTAGVQILVITIDAASSPISGVAMVCVLRDGFASV